MRLFARLATASIILSSFISYGVGDMVARAGASPSGFTYYVNATTDDAVMYALDCTSPANTDCGIDDAINAFDSDTAPGNTDTILFSSGLSTFTMTNPNAPQVFNQTSGISLDIVGNGPDVTTVNGGIANTTGVFEVNQTATVSISGLTITGGSNSMDVGGGGVWSQYSRTTLTNDTLTNDSAWNGGAVYNTYGSVTMDNDTLSDDSALNNGGGVYSDLNGSVSMSNVTFSDDSAANDGGGVFGNDIASTTMTNDTFANDTAVNGGGVFNTGTATMTNDTFYNTVTNSPFSEIDSPGITTIANSILENPLSCAGTVIDGGHNVESDDSCGFDALGSTSIVNSGSIGLATSLATNGSSGPETLAIESNSSAFSEVPVSSCVITTDERGITRPGVNGMNCDAGAYELTPISETIQLFGTPVAGNNSYFVIFTASSGSPNPTESVLITDNASNSCTAALVQVTSSTYGGACVIDNEVAGASVTATYDADLADLNYLTATSSSLTVGTASAPPSGGSAPASVSMQNIVFNPLISRHWGDSPFSVLATASSGLNVSFTSQTPEVCDVSGSTVTILGTGTCTIVATQVGNVHYSAASAISRSFSVTPVNPGIASIRVTSPSKGRLRISLARPVTDGGQSIMMYQYSLDGRRWMRVSETSGGFVIAGLRLGTTYSVRLRALNDVGPGSASRPVRIMVK